MIVMSQYSNKCAQCGGDHLSTALVCNINQQYREEVNEAVNQAIDNGILKATIVNNRLVPPNINNLNDYPMLNKIRPAPWSNVYTTTNNNNKVNNDTSLTLNNNSQQRQVLTTSLEDLEDKCRSVAKDTDKKIDSMCNLLMQVIPALASLFESLIINVIGPMIVNDNDKQQKLKECQQKFKGIIDPILVITKKFVVNNANVQEDVNNSYNQALTVTSDESMSGDQTNMSTPQ
ncbi:unnamed protein product, partial [Didymodactylos carnosus]